MNKVLFFAVLTAFLVSSAWCSGHREDFRERNPLIFNVHYGSDKNDIGKDTVLFDGGVYVAGVTLGELPGSKSSGEWDIFLLRYDPGGMLVWSRQFGTPGRDGAMGIAADSSGVYIAGYAEGSLEGQNRHGGFDIFLSRFDFDGNMIWTRQWGTEEDDKGLDVTICGKGIYVTGFTKGDLDGNRSAGKSDLFLTMFDRDGEKIFTLQRGTELPDWGNALAADDEGLYVTGFTQGVFSGDKAFGHDDIILVKYDFDGNELWSRQWGTEGNDEGNGVTAVSGRVYVAGRTGGGLDGCRHFKYDDAFFSMCTSGGDKRRTVIIGTDSNETATGIAFKNSRIYIAGNTRGELVKKGKTGYSDVYLAVYSLEGKKIMISQYGTGGFDFSGGLYASSEGIYMTGDSSFSISGRQNSGGNRDIILLKWKP